MSILKVGVLGAGRIGRLHATNIVRSIPEAKLISIADVYANEEMIEWAKSIGVEKVYKDPAQVINDPEVEAVLICSSTDTHTDLMIACAEAGKHIFCEKPIDFNLEKIDLALKAVTKADVKLMIGFVRRYDHNHKKVRDVVASGQLGRPHVIKITSRDPEPPPIEYVAVSGGLFMDMMIHDFDMARYLAGSEVVEVSAYGNVLIDERLNELDDVDTAVVILKFENGSLGVIDNSRKAGYGYDQRTEVHCEKGCVQVGNDTSNTSMISTPEGVFMEKPVWFFLERYNDAFINEVNNFVTAVQGKSEILVTGVDGLMATKIAVAAKKSMDEKRAVALSEI